MSRGWRSVLGVIGLAALALTACDPIPHTEFEAVELPGGAVDLELLADFGAYAVVEASGPSTTVPGAGWWRIDRRDGSVVEVDLGTGHRPTAISPDGSRIVSTAAHPPSSWFEGAVQSLPAGEFVVFSTDLSHAVFRDPADGEVKRWRAADGSVLSIEDAFPRPSGYTVALPRGVSDDGQTIHYRFGGTGPTRFVDLDAGSVLDVPSLDDPNDVVDDEYELSADGGTAAHTYQRTACSDASCLESDLVESWVELVDTSTGTAGDRYVNQTLSDPHPERIERVEISANGVAAWVFQTGYGSCGAQYYPPLPSWWTCGLTSTATAVTDAGHASFDTGPGVVESVATTRHGRMAVVVRESGNPVVPGTAQPRVLDWVADSAEVLTGDVDGDRATGASISWDGRTVATTTTAGGWYEYRAP